MSLPTPPAAPAPAQAPQLYPTAWERARGRINSSFGSWVAAIAVAGLAFFLRIWHLGQPRAFQFDETYYAKDAWSMLNHGYVLNYADKADKAILNGDYYSSWQDDPSMVVHPEFGKWLIALGEKAFGMDPFGWRIAAAVAGALMVLVMVRLARRLTGSTLLGCVAGLLLCFDGLHFVLSRLALLDIFVALFLTCAVACLVLDRDWFRARLAARIDTPLTKGWGPVRATLWRPWLLTAGVMFGLAVGTKWTALYPMAAFGLLVWLWSAGARRSFGVRRSVLKSAVVDAAPAFGYLVVVGFLVYVATWGGWLQHVGQYEETLSNTQYTRFLSPTDDCEGKLADDNTWPTATEKDASGPAEIVQSLRSLAYYHHDVYTFHTQFLNCSEHGYASHPRSWLVLGRPVGVNADNDIQPGDQGCEAAKGSDCIRQVLLLGNPAIWWAGALALGYAGYVWVRRRDWRYGMVVIGALSSWLPWFLSAGRPIFSFYAIVVLPFTVLALTFLLGELASAGTPRSRKRIAGALVAGAFFAATILLFIWFWPVWTNQLLTHDEWANRMWFSRWI